MLLLLLKDESAFVLFSFEFLQYKLWKISICNAKIYWDPNEIIVKTRKYILSCINLLLYKNYSGVRVVVFVVSFVQKLN